MAVRAVRATWRADVGCLDANAGGTSRRPARGNTPAAVADRPRSSVPSPCGGLLTRAGAVGILILAGALGCAGEAKPTAEAPPARKADDPNQPNAPQAAAKPEEPDEPKSGAASGVVKNPVPPNEGTDPDAEFRPAYVFDFGLASEPGPLPPTHPTPRPSSLRKGADRTDVQGPQKLLSAGLPPVPPPTKLGPSKIGPAKLGPANLGPAKASETSGGSASAPPGGATAAAGMQSEQGPSSAAVWNLEPDPLPDRPSAAPSLERVELGPAGKSFPDPLLLCGGTRPVAAVVQREARGRRFTFYDVPAWKQIGEVATPDVRGPFAVQGEAGLFAYQPLESRVEKFLVLVSIADGKEVARLKAVAGFDPGLGTIEFAGPKTIFWEGPAQTLLWTIPDPTPRVVPWKHLEFASIPTPGGKYLARVAFNTMVVVETATGKKVGTLTLPAGAVRGEPGDRRQGGAPLAFSPDGREFAVGVDDGRATLYVYDFATGKVRDVVPTGEGAAAPSLRYIQWLPDGSGWLLGRRWVVDRKSGRALQLPDERERGLNFQARTLLLPDERLLTTTQPLPKAPQEQFVLSPLNLAAARAKSQEAQSAAASALPELAEADWSAAQAIPAALPAGWALRPDPTRSKEVDVPFRLELEGAGRRVESVHWNEAKQQAVVQIGEPPPGVVHALAAPAFYRISVVDAATGASRLEHRFPPGTQLVATSPGGALFATLSGKSRDRLDVWDFDGVKHLMGARPFVAAGAPEEVPTPSGATSATIRWCGFADDELLWTSSEGGRLVCWKLPELKAKFVYDGPIVSPPQFSPGRAALGFLTPAGLRWLDARSGAVLGEAPLRRIPPQAGDEFCVSPDGAYAAVGGGGRFSFVDLSTGEADSAASCIPYAGGELDWFRGPCLWADGTLYDVRSQAAVWHYHTTFGGRIEERPRDGRRWQLATEGGPKDFQAWLLACPLPHAEAAWALARLSPAPPPALRRGGKVRLNWGAPATFHELDPLRKHIEDELRTIGVAVADDAPLALNVDFERQDRGVVLVRGGEKTSQTARAFALKASLHDADGGRIWRQIHLSDTPREVYSEAELKGLQLDSRAPAPPSTLRFALPREIRIQPYHPKDGPRFQTLQASSRFDLKLLDAFAAP